jgi:hypothetical protein
MVTTMKICVAYMNQVSRSKVTVTFRGHLKTLLQSKTSTHIKGFQYNFAQMFIIVRGGLRAKFMSLQSRSHIAVKVKIWRILMKLHRNVHHYEKQCHVHDQGSRSKVKVRFRGHWKTLVPSKTSTCIEGFQYYLAQMFAIVMIVQN